MADDVHVVGMLCVVTENTDRVLSERRMATLRDMATALAPARTEVEALTAVEDQLATNPYDLPFSLVYLYDDDGGARLVCASGIERGTPAAPVGIAPTDADRGWPAQRVRAGHTELVEDLAERFTQLPAGAWTRSPTAAVVTALPGAPGENRVRGFLVVGLNPFRPFDERYRGFIELTAAQISSALVNAGVYEAERHRAEALAELDRAKTEFFSNVSHEFRTPLTLIMGPIEALRAAEPVDAHRVRTELEVAHRNGLRLGRLVNTLLDFSRLQAGRMQARFVPTDLGAFTAELAGMFRSATERARLRLDVEVDELDEPVWVDRDSWEKIVSNLLSNAVKFTLDGAVGVRLRPAGRAVRLEVTDTGIGIPAEETGRLFERFHQVRGARGRSAEGSGIGLALVRDLVGLHGGTVTVRSRPGEGTTFTVEIPLGDEHLPQDQVVADEDESVVGASSVAESFVAEALRWMDTSGEPAGAGPVATDATQATQRLLIADDNADMRDYMVRLLGGTYELHVVADGPAALAAARSDPPDLVITDVMMPGLDGFALLAALRADRATAAVPVIVLSARAGQDAVVEGLAAGADDYLVKPFAATELLARVRSALALARVRRREAAWRGALLGALQDGLFVVDGTGQVVQINDGFADIFGYGREGLPYAVPHPWWPDPEREPDEHQQVLTAMAEVQASGQARTLLALRHRDGHRLWIECSADTIVDPDRPGGPPMIIGLARDVTAVHRVGQRDRLLAQTAQILSSTEPAAAETTAAETGSAGGRLVERIQRVVDLAAPVFDDLVTVVRTSPDGRTPPVAAAHPRRPEQARQMLAMDPHRLPTSLLETDRQGRAFVLDPTPPALLREAFGSDADSATHAGLGRHATLVAPLAVHGRLLGLLLVLCPGDHLDARSEASGRFEELDVELAEELARRIAAALQTHWVATREHQLNTAATALAAAGTVSAAAAALVAAVRRAFDPSGVGIYVPRSDNPARLQLIHSEGLPHGVFERHATVDVQDRAVTAEAARTGRAVWHSGPTRLFDGAGAVAAGAALPLRQAGRTVGVLDMTFATAREFADDERSFATTLVTQAAQAFERAALTDARAQVADTLQHSLLPTTPPAVDRLALATHYLPGVAGVQAGGDWYDVITLDPRRTAIVVGDVVGQGAQAAAVMGQLRATLSAILTMLGPGSDPAEALARLNDYAPRVPGARG
ncbi:MAG: GAF domain-containing protein, partial [Pseudonocardia sp.]|nr:GAF domain-containing protein [Pseudonocardia sp.]